jgi:hypothetical protein
MQFSNILVELASKGGQLARPQNELIQQIEKLSSEEIVKIDRSSGLEINAAMLASMMDTVRWWKTKQQTKP